MTLRLKRKPRWPWTYTCCKLHSWEGEFDIYTCPLQESKVIAHGEKLGYIVMIFKNNMYYHIRESYREGEGKAVEALHKARLLDKRDIVKALQADADESS